MNRARTNFWVDVAIGITGVISAVSGLVFLLPGDPASGILGVSYQVWNTLHTWSSLAAVAGVGAHLLLHWKWLAAMTQRALVPRSRQDVRDPAAELAYGWPQDRPLSRRAFLVFGGTAAVVAGVVVAGYKALFDASPAQASQSRNQLTATQQEGGVACPFGLVEDPYPGRCRRYVDSNGDGICDYSVPGSGSNLLAADSGGFHRRHSGFGQP